MESREFTALVSMCLQSLQLEALLAGSFLTESERDILKWGKNAKIGHQGRFPGEKRTMHKNARALECLVRTRLRRTQ